MINKFNFIKDLITKNNGVVEIEVEDKLSEIFDDDFKKQRKYLLTYDNGSINIFFNCYQITKLLEKINDNIDAENNEKLANVLEKYNYYTIGE